MLRASSSPGKRHCTCCSPFYSCHLLNFRNDQFVACTSPNNAASIIAATGIQTDIANNCTSLGNTSFPFSANNTIPGGGGNNSTQGINGTSSAPGHVASSTPLLSQTLPPTTTTVSPEQASSLTSSARGSNSPSVPSNTPNSINNSGGNSDGALPVIHLTSAPVSSPTPTPTPTPSSVGNPLNGGY